MFALPEPQPLKSRVVRAAGWALVARVLGGGVTAVKLVVLARLLAPADFGLFGIVMLAIVTLRTFTQTGFHTALIQRRDNAEAYLDTAWTAQVLRGLLRAGVLLAAAPVVGWFFEEPRAVPLLRVMCASVVLDGFVNIGVVYFRKELQFHKQFLYQFPGSVVSLAVGLFLAYRLRSVWALVWAGVAEAATRCAISFAIHHYRPRPRLDWRQVQELFRFGRWMLGTSVVTFLATRGADAFLGKMLGAGALGLYQIAYRLSNDPMVEITGIAHTVMMPAYAKVQAEEERVARVFLRVSRFAVSLVWPLALFVLFAAPEVVVGLLGPKWEAAVVPAQLLAAAACLRAVIAVGQPVFVGTGRPHVLFWAALVRLAVMAASIYPLTKSWGVAGAAISVVLSLLAALPLWVGFISVLGVTWRGVVRSLAPGALLGLCVAVGVQGARLIAPAAPLAALACELAAAGVLCGLAGWLTGTFRELLSPRPTDADADDGAPPGSAGD